MEAQVCRSKLAAAAASVVPFHCVICFEEFNLTDRTPMVLPCSHTYVCNQCCKRLKRCMECREPLFLPKPTTKPNNNNPHRGTGRYSPSPPAAPQSPPTPIALPIPKNLVLIALMEAAERQSKVEREAKHRRADNSDDDEEEEDEYDLDRIISGMSTLSGPCGTYAVKEEGGLPVVRSNPRRESEDEIEKKDSNADEKKESEDDEQEEKGEPQLLSKGQTVQVVSFYEGVAKLARGHGFVVANSSQLVKGQYSSTFYSMKHRKISKLFFLF
jgi:hypothetical protein